MLEAVLIDSRIMLRATDGPRRHRERVAARICAKILLLRVICPPFSA
jgi:hypothetical protein